ncbi:MAG: SufS family cysteine desulfurase [Candidatus Peribacteraceae bacterium]|nr:SufS family cysteine desulfurase [Candidatus Peribacteraceae bacterium]MDD5742815.1 SufS family cysteine desulfurase [Candidatus Peribacteraceae bacterium]
MALDSAAIRRQFPCLQARERLTYLDSAASAQKPESVLQTMDAFARREYASVHRGLYPLSEGATDAYEQARETVRAFIGAEHRDEIIFTKSTTESLNLLAKSWGHATLKKGDAVALTLLEHHSNIVPWLQLKEEKGIEMVWIDIDDEGRLKQDELTRALKKGNVKLVSVTGLSNVLGVRPPVKDMIAAAHQSGALVAVDAAQLVGHHPISVRELDCDFLAFSGHKPYGPTGIGVLYAKRSLLRAMPPFLGGGMMIREVHRDGFTPADAPQKFEAGTPPITEAIGLKAALEWLGSIGWKDIETYEAKLMETAYETLKSIPGLHILGHKDPAGVSGCVSFVLEGIHPHDLTDLLGQEEFCLRAGHHCTQTLHERLGITASTRLSIGLYNTEEEIRALGLAVTRAIKVLAT